MLAADAKYLEATPVGTKTICVCLMRLQRILAGGRLRTCLVWLLLGGLGGCGPADLTAGDAWLRAPVPGTDKTSAYVTLENPTARGMRVISARASGVGAIEFHETVVTEGIARMRRLGGVEIPPETTVDLEPGGKHLMLFRIDNPDALPETVPIALTLRTAEGERVITVGFRVVSYLD